MARLLLIDGTEKDITPNNGECFSLDEMQSLVGGNIEMVDLGWLRNNEMIVSEEGDYMIVNEEGKLMNLPINPAATNILNGRDIIAGPALICSNVEFQ